MLASSTLTDDGNCKDTSGVVTHDTHSRYSGKKRRAGAENTNNDDDDDKDDGNGGVTKYARSNGDDDVSSRHLEYSDDASVDEPSPYTILWGLIRTEKFHTILNVAVEVNVIDRKDRRLIYNQPGQNTFLNYIYHTVNELSKYYSSCPNGVELLNTAIYTNSGILMKQIQMMMRRGVMMKRRGVLLTLPLTTHRLIIIPSVMAEG